VPVRRAPLATPLMEIAIDYSRDWIREHLRSIEVNYRAAPHFEPLFGDLADVLGRRYERLVELNAATLTLLMKHLAIATTISKSSDVPRNPARYVRDADARNERILEICQHHDARVLYDGKRAADFLDVAKFERAGIATVFQDYVPVPYRQVRGPFVSHLSVIDLVMNTGPDAPRILRSPLPSCPPLDGSRAHAER